MTMGVQPAARAARAVTRPIGPAPLTISWAPVTKAMQVISEDQDWVVVLKLKVRGDKTKPNQVRDRETPSERVVGRVRDVDDRDK